MWALVSKHVSYAYYVPAESSSQVRGKHKNSNRKGTDYSTSHEYQHQICSSEQ